ncbi:MAG: hypothetical protein ACFFAO_14310 [Candidatus Hermodarchaeota archaeon]
MPDLSKPTKIVFFINAIIAFIYAFLFIAIPDIYAQYTDAMVRDIYSPITWRQLGVSILVLGIGSILSINRQDIEKAKIFWEIAIIWVVLMLVVNIWSIFTIPATSVSFLNDIIAIVVLIYLSAVNIYFYYRETQ